MAVRFRDDSKVFFQLDWFTIIFRNASIDDCIDYLNLFDILTEDRTKAWSDWKLNSYGYDKTYRFYIDNVKIEIRPDELQSVLSQQNMIFDNVNGYDLCSWKLPFVRVEFSGQGLEFLRSRGYDCDTEFLKIVNIPVHDGSFGLDITRTDFAFDFVNIESDFLDSCVDYSLSMRDPSSLRVPVGDNTAGKKCGVKLGDQKTIYFGTGRSDLLLRIYDKKMEYLSKKKLLSDAPFYNDLEFQNIDSWVRVEMETSTRAVGSIIDTAVDSRSLFRFITEKFAPRKDWKLNSGICDFWFDYFDYDQISGIILNRKSAQYVSTLERADRVLNNIALSSILVSIAARGRMSVEVHAMNSFYNLQYSKFPSDRKRFLNILNKILDIYGVLPDTMYIDHEGIYRFK